MKLAPLLLLHILLCLALAFHIPKRDYAQKQYFVVEIDTLASNTPLLRFIADHNDSYTFEHVVGGLDNHFVFSLPKNHPHAQFLGNFNSNDYALMKRDGHEQQYDALANYPGLKLIHMVKPVQLHRRMPVPVEESKRTIPIVDSSQEPLREVSEKLGINDPTFAEQWHLINTQYPGNDVNVKNLWLDGIRGKGVTVAVIDDGLDSELSDLADNFSKEGLWDFNDNTNLPQPRLFDDYHGTRCAGEIAAVKNDVCGIGVAYEAKVAGIRILSGAITSDQEAAAMIYGLGVNDIYSCSWGPTDNGRTVAAPDLLVKKAIIKGVQEGRDSKGSLYVFASGNGGRAFDQCNFDGYTNSIYSITVGAIDYKGLHPNYAEACSAVMVVTYSSGSGEHIHTTDIHKKCSAIHGGTSAAAPLAAGVYALLLQANPALTWRDVQYVSAMAAVPVHEDDGDYQVTALGQKYSHKYGYGKIDAQKLVDEGKKWKNVNPQAWYYSDVVSVDQKVTSPAGKDSAVLTSTVTITQDTMNAVNLKRIEHVTVKVNIASTARGKIGVKLVSPSGVTSTLARYRPLDSSNRPLLDWVFMSVAHMGEAGLGDWRLEVVSGAGENEVHFRDWQLRFFGESIDAAKAETYDVTKDYAAERRDKAATTTTTTAPSETGEPETAASESAESGSEDPSADVPPRPTNASPVTDSDPDPISATADPISSADLSSAGPISSGTSAADPSEEKTPEDDEDNHDGANKHYTTDHAGQYFMALAVVGFLVVIVMMKWHKTPGGSRRRRRDEYEFDIIPGEDYSDSEDDGASSFDLGHTPEEQLRERLYDEFNAESLPDYEDDMFQIGDEEEELKATAATGQAEAQEDSAPADGTVVGEDAVDTVAAK